MHVSYLLIFISLSVWAQPKPRIEVIPNPQTLEDFDHQFKGCPENSECDQVMGLQLSRWKELIEKLKNEVSDPKKKAQFMELFRGKYGIPVEFYTYQKSQQGFKPVLFDSPCKEHNPKTGPKTLRGISFLKSLNEKTAVVWRDQTQIEVPVDELLIPQPIFVWLGAEPTLYYLPLGDQPLFIKDKSLFVLKETEDYFYMLKVSPNGEWKVEDVDMTKLSSWEEKRSYVTCPKIPANPNPTVFKDEFCKTVWSDDLKKPVTVKMFQGCSI